MTLGAPSRPRAPGGLAVAALLALPAPATAAPPASPGGGTVSPGAEPLPQPAPARRVLPERARPGESVTVTLEVDPPDDVAAYALLESPPDGWAVASVSAGGRFDAEEGRIEWRFTGGQGRRVTYRVRPPSGAAGQVSFSGEAVLDGASSAVGGDRSLRVGPPSGRLPDGAALRLPGSPDTLPAARKGPPGAVRPGPAGAGGVADLRPGLPLPDGAAAGPHDPGAVPGGIDLARVPGIAGSGRRRVELSIPTAGHLPPGRFGRSYGHALRVAGGDGPYLWTVVKGVLPPGLSLLPEQGRIRGVPDRAGLYAFTLSVTGRGGAGVEKAFALAVAPAPAGIVIAKTRRIHDGEPKPVAVRTDPPGLDVSVTYAGGVAPPVEPGEYPVVVEVTSPDHRGSARATLVIREPGAERDAGTRGEGER